MKEQLLSFILQVEGSRHSVYQSDGFERSSMTCSLISGKECDSKGTNHPSLHQAPWTYSMHGNAYRSEALQGN